MPSRWIPEFVVWRLTDIGPMRLRVHSLAHALYWGRFLCERWGERTWIEHCNAPAHDYKAIDTVIARD